MQITEIELVGYKRMKLTNPRTFKMTLNDIIQVILGTNGSGKSSLMYELSPLPGAMSDFHKDGSKTIRIIDGQDSYVLRSWFSPSQRHSFKKNDEELNGTDGGTMAQQKDLVREHFKITPEIRDMLIGTVRFTSMGVADRRYWMMLLSEVNYDYAVETYKRLGKRARDTQGALNHAIKRLATESEKVITGPEEQLLNNEVNEIHRALDAMMERRSPIPVPSSHYQQENDVRLNELNAMSNRLMRMKFITPYSYHRQGRLERDEWGQLIRPSFTSIAQVDTVIDELRHETTAKQTLLNNYLELHSKASKQLEVLTRTGEDSIIELREQLAVKSGIERDWLRQRKLGLEGVAAKEGIAALDYVQTSLSELLDGIPSNPEQQYSQAKMQAAEQETLRFKDLITQLEHRMKMKVAAKDHMEQHKNHQETQCPKCSHRWNLRYDQAKYLEMMQEIAELDKELNTYRRALDQEQSLYETNRNYGEQFRAYHRLTRSFPALAPFWDHITTKKYITENPRQILIDLNIFHADLNLTLAAEKAKEESFAIINLIAAKEQLGGLTIATVRLEVEEHAVVIEELTATISTLQLSISEHAAYRRQLTEMFSLSEKIDKLKQDAFAANEQMVEVMYLETVQQCIRHLRSALSRKEEVLAFVSMQRGLVEDLKSQVELLQIQDEAASLLVRELSPTEGLIADGLLGFISSFMRQMNSIIRKVWTYPMTVESCAVEGTAELDYKFPLRVDDEDKPVPDVKMGSTGQKEIVDLAFKISAMKCLGILHGPLYADEFATSFDPLHRQAASAVLNTLMETKPFTQLFMVSHYEESYGVFNNAEVCVLCPSNIVIPGNQKYNEHVLIT